MMSKTILRKNLNNTIENSTNFINTKLLFRNNLKVCHIYQKLRFNSYTVLHLYIDFLRHP